MSKQKRVELNPANLLGLKHLVGSKGEKTIISQAMVGYKVVVGYKVPPLAA